MDLTRRGFLKVAGAGAALAATGASATTLIDENVQSTLKSTTTQLPTKFDPIWDKPSEADLFIQVGSKWWIVDGRRDRVYDPGSFKPVERIVPKGGQAVMYVSNVVVVACTGQVIKNRSGEYDTLTTSECLMIASKATRGPRFRTPQESHAFWKYQHQLSIDSQQG